MKRKSLLYVGNALSHKGITVTTIDTLSASLRQEGYTVKLTSSQKNKLRRLMDMLSTTFRFRSKVDIVLIDTYSTSNYWYAVFVAWLCRLSKLPYIPILHGGNLPQRLVQSKRTAKQLFGKAYMNVAPSAYLLTRFQEAGFTKLVHIPNAIQIDNYPFKKRDSFVPRLLWVRSLATIYNPMMALEVLQKLLKDYPEASLCMVGPDKDGSMGKCVAFAKANNLPVTFTGKLTKEEWSTLATDYDIFINTTNFDNTPVSVIEAMALGLVVVSTNVGGLPFLIANDEDGFLVGSGDVEAMTICIHQILNQPSKAITVCAKARLKAESFDWKMVKTLWKQLLS